MKLKSSSVSSRSMELRNSSIPEDGKVSASKRKVTMMTNQSARSTTPARQLTMVAMMAALTAALSFVAIPLPFSPVPVTGQSFGIMLSGALLGPWRGALSVAIYILLGAAGLPVFAGGKSGPGVLAGPTGGYLWGFLLGAFITGALLSTPRNGAHKKEPAWRTFLAIVLGGLVVVDVLGVIHLSKVTGLPLRRALAVGVYPFLPGDLLKAIVATALARREAVRRLTMP